MNMTASQRDLEFALIKFHLLHHSELNPIFMLFFLIAKKHLNGDSLGEKKDNIFNCSLRATLTVYQFSCFYFCTCTHLKPQIVYSF